MTALIILSTIALGAILGMFYWMGTIEEGECPVSSRAWHWKLIKWMWEADEHEVKNACPYYWSIWISVLVLPLYLFIRWILFPFGKGIYFIWKKIRPKRNLRTRWKMPEVAIPNGVKGVYTVVYKKSESILKAVFTILVVFSVLYIIIAGLLQAYSLFGLTVVAVMIGSGTFVIVTFYVWLVYPEYNRYHIDIYEKFFTAVMNLIWLPFKGVFAVIAWLAKKLFGIIKDQCPPIRWED